MNKQQVIVVSDEDGNLIDVVPVEKNESGFRAFKRYCAAVKREVGEDCFSERYLDFDTIDV